MQSYNTYKHLAVPTKISSFSQLNFLIKHNSQFNELKSCIRVPRLQTKLRKLSYCIAKYLNLRNLKYFNNNLKYVCSQLFNSNRVKMKGIKIDQVYYLI